MARGRLKLTGVGKLLKDTRPIVAAAAEQIAAAAGPGFEAESSVGSKRALAMVWADTWQAKRAEDEDWALTRAVDAGRP